MAEVNDFGDIRSNLEQIASVLDSVREQNTANAGNMGKVLTGINNQLEILSNEENADLIKIFLAELKKNLEEKHNFVSSKFNEIENSFKYLAQKAEAQPKTGEIKELFEIIATNLNVFSKDFSAQKNLVSEIGLKLEELKQDDSRKKDILKSIAELYNNVSKEMEESKDLIKFEIDEGASNVSEKIDLAKKEIAENSKSNLSNILEHIQSVINNIFSVKNALHLENAETVETLGNKMKDLRENINEDLKSNFSEIQSSISAIPETIKENMASPVNDSLIPDLSNDINKKFEGLLINITQLEEIFASKNKDSLQTVLGALEEKASAFEGLVKSSDEAKTAILEQITKSKNETETAILEELEENINFLKEVLVSISSEKTLPDELSQKIDTLQAAFQKIANNLESKLSKSEENYKTSTQSLISNIKTSFYEKVDDGLDGLKSFIELIEGKKNFPVVLDELKSDILDKFSEYTDNLEKAVSSISVKEDLEGLSEEIKDSVGSLFAGMEEKFISSLENNEKIDSLFEKSEEITRRVEDLKNVIAEDIVQKLDSFELSIDTQKMDISGLIEELKASLAELKENYIDLSLNSTMEISALLVTIQEKIENIEKNIENIGNSKNDFSKEFEEINQKLDILAIDSDEEIEEDVKEIKQIVQSQNDFIEKLDKLPDSDEIISIKNDIQKTLENFGEKLNSLSSGNSKNELNLFKEELFGNLIEIFNQISFVAEAEEIKDFVEEKTDDIKETLKDSLGSNFNDILSSLDILHEKTSAADNSYFDIKNEIQEVKEHLLSTKNSAEDGSEYSYTLQDIESDITKVRLILKEISQSKTELDTDKLSEDILSISSRTNKLLLNSDESYTALKENLSDFKNIMYQLEEKVRYLDNTEAINRVEKKLEDINNLTLSSVKSDKIFNQTFMYLAEWVDKASENFQNIIEKASDIDNIKQSLGELKKSMPKSAVIETVLDEISEKFDQQQERINSLEEKIETLAKGRPAEINPKEIAKEILTQMELPENKADIKLVKKVDNIEKQLAKLSKGVEKLASYVDEE